MVPQLWSLDLETLSEMQILRPYPDLLNPKLAFEQSFPVIPMHAEVWESRVYPTYSIIRKSNEFNNVEAHEK